MTNGNISTRPTELHEALKRRRRIIEGAPPDGELGLDKLWEEKRRTNRREASTQTAAREEAPSPLVSSGCSESRLRVALTQSGVSTQELKEAVLAVEALLGEAKRELQNRQFRERRAAFERLHTAIARDDEAVLIEAIAEARRTEVEAEDIEKAEEVLKALQALTDEQRAARAAKERLTENRTRAFLLVKRDDVQALRSLLEEMDASGLEWKGWKDHARRTLFQCSCQLGAQKVQAFLGPILKPQPATLLCPECADPENSPLSQMKSDAPALSPAANAVAPEQVDVDAPKAEAKKGEGVVRRPRTLSFHCPLEDGEPPTLSQAKCAPAESVIPAVEAAAPEASLPNPAAKRVAPEEEEPAAGEGEALSPEEETKLRLAAFRAVVKDDTPTLADIIHEKVPLEIWSNWVNKGGKDLLTLSEERGSCAAYSMLARALGLLKMRKRSSFCESEFVWVMLAGDVQPRRATVIEDVSDESDQICVEFWDDSSDPMWVDRDFVLKSS